MMRRLSKSTQIYGSHLREDSALRHKHRIPALSAKQSHSSLTAKGQSLHDPEQEQVGLKIMHFQNRKIKIAFGCAILALLVMGAISFRVMLVSRESDRWVRHTHEVLDSVHDLLFSMESIKSSDRGYALSGEAFYVDAYHASLLKMNQDVENIRGLTADNPIQQQQLSIVEKLIVEQTAHSDEVLRLRNSQGLASAAAVVASPESERLRTQFDAAVSMMQNEEQRLLVLRDAETRLRLYEAKMALIVGTLMGLLIVGTAAWFSLRDSTARGLAEERYRGLLEAAPDAMVVVDELGEIVLLNVQAEKQFGYNRDELVGQKITNIIPTGFAERLIADGTRTAAQALAQQIGTGIELNALRKDGSRFPIEIMLSPLENADGILVTAAVRDITVRRAAEAHLVNKVDELNRSNVELERFAYIASHDLQEPLRMVASYTQLLARRYKGKLDADADEFISFAVDGAQRMQRLIQDLLLFSRVGTQGVELVETSSEDALQSALVNLRSAVKASGALITHDPLPAVMADEMQLVQLFQNLVGNAIKYQKPGVPTVHISATRSGSKWDFSVKDNGLGIEPQYFEKIFGMFQRLHKREEFAGTGIGLAICRKIVERHGGTITVESQPGQGSTFHFVLAER
jgi:PAS domain S-box-containing protein